MVALSTLPTANVTVGLSSSDPTEGTVSPASLTFTSASGTTPQTVTVTGVDDGVVDGNVAYTLVIAVATSADPHYNGRKAADVRVTNTDNDVGSISVTPTAGLTTTEAGGTATFMVALSTLPTANVTVGLSSSDPTEGTVSPASLTFTSASGTTPQTVTVTGVDDGVVDGNVAYTLVIAVATSADPHYNGRKVADVRVTNTDNDVAVPNVVGLTQSVAQAAIANAGLIVGMVKTANSATVAADKVISQNPPAQSNVGPGSTVVLVISSGLPVFLMGIQNDPNTGPTVNSLYRLRIDGVVTKIADLDHRTHGLAFVGATLYSVEELTLSRSGTPPKLYTLNPDTGATLATIPLTLSTGEAVEGARGLATEPGTNQLWALLIVPSEANSFRRVVTINPLTGLATQIAKIPGNFVDMAFDAAGTLYAIADNRPVSGGSSVLPARLYTVQKATGATTEFLDVSAGAVAGQPNFRESETIGAGVSSDLLYHLSGQNKNTACCSKNMVFESIHRTTKARTTIALTGPAFFVTTAMTVPPPDSARALGDLDANSTADLVWRNIGSGAVAVWLMNGIAIASTGFPGGLPSEWQLVGVGDVNGDGRADVICRHGTSGMVAVWLMNGLSITAVGFPGSASTDWRVRGVGDVNGDGKADLVWRNTSDGTTAIWMMNGTAVVSSGFPGGVPLAWQIAGVGDVNGDGKADVIWRNNTSGTVAVWLMNGLASTAVGFPGSASPEFEIAGVGDVNGDGKADLVWRNTNNGTTAIWLMNGIVIASTGFPGGVPSHWQIAKVGDVNGDGKADVIWHHRISGTVAVWLMNGLAITAVGFPGSASTDWVIQ